MVKCNVVLKSLFLFMSLLTSIGVSNSQTRVFDLNNQESKESKEPLTFESFKKEQAKNYNPGINRNNNSNVVENYNNDVRLQGIKQEDGSVVFHQLDEDDDLLFSKEEDGTIVDHAGNVIEEKKPEVHINPFYRAIVTRNIQQVKLLLASGTNPNTVFDDGNTALHLAANYKDEELVDLLISYNASLNIKNKEKATPLHMMCAYGSKAMLIQAKKSLSDGYVKALNTEGGYKRNCLHYAMLTPDNEAIVTELLSSGMNASHISEDGQTPAHYAAMYGHWSNIKTVANYDINLLHIKAVKVLDEKTTEDLMFDRMGIIYQVDFLKYFSEDKQDLLNERFNKANI